MKNSRLKSLLIYLIAHPYTARPRLWVRLLVTPLRSHRGAGSKIRFSARMDIFPNHRFALGRRSIIESLATLNNGVGDLIIGDNSRIGIGCTLIGPIVIGNEVHLAQNIVLSGLNHNYKDPLTTIHSQGTTTAAINIEDDVWIGANAFIAAGVTIGSHSVVGAGAIVTRSVPELSVVAGNPAKVIKQYNNTTQTWETPKS